MTTEHYTTLAIVHMVAVIACFVFAQCGPMEHRETAKWIGVTLATAGIGGLLWLLTRREKRVPYHLEPDHTETDAREEEIDERVEDLEWKLDGADKGIDDDVLGEDMARRLRDE